MPDMMMMGEGGSINPDRVLMIVSLKSEPVKRLLKHLDKRQVINMTYGYPRRSLIVFDTGMMAVTSHEVDVLTTAIKRGEGVDDAL